MLTRIGTLSLFIVLFFHASVLAHGGKPHVMGTVTALDAQHVVVQTKEGKTVSILLNGATKYRKGEAAATGADLKIGNRVVVDTTGEGDMLTASEIRFASPGGEKGHGSHEEHGGMTHSPMKP
jgi:hypothetical protein